MLPCFPLCRMTSGCCLSNWLGLQPIRAQTGKVPLGYTNPKNKKRGAREKERERAREREQRRHRLDCATEAFLHGIWEMFLLKGNCSSSVCCREARCVLSVLLQRFQLIHWPELWRFWPPNPCLGTLPHVALWLTWEKTAEDPQIPPLRILLIHLEREDIPDTGWTTAMLSLTLCWLLDSLLVQKRDTERSVEKNLCSPGLEFEESWSWLQEQGF